MGLFSFLKGQFIEVIEWNNTAGDIVYKFPVYDNAIKMGAQLIVREAQAAIFVNEGVIADVFGPGRHTLQTENMPLLTGLKSWKYGFNSPFKADVYFVSTAIFTDQKWGTTNPVIMRDPELGAIRVRGFGNFSYRVSDPALFMRSLFGSNEQFTPDNIHGYFKTLIISSVSDALAESQIPVIDIATRYEELSQGIALRLESHFRELGFAFTGFVIENLSLPPEVEAMIDRKSSMNIAGNLDQYMKYQTAEAIRESANNTGGGLAGAGAGMGAAMAMGQMMQGALNPNAQNGNTPPTPQPAISQPSGSQPVPTSSSAPLGQSNEDTRQSAEQPNLLGDVACDSCQTPMKPGDKFCSQCGTPRPVASFCKECGTKLAADAKFCSGCGTKQ
jgi:membrane protease subunit (stomatin/prohibitin family)